jgi:DNA polymerase-3 subunit delta'
VPEEVYAGSAFRTYPPARPVTYLPSVPLLPLHGHTTLRARFDAAIRRDALPGSLLLHGPRGVGKQRLALWLGQRLVCDGPEPRPCGECQQCRYALAGTHPDLHWFFPRPRLKDGDASPEEIERDLREAALDRLKTGAYSPPPPADGIFVSTIRAIVHSASLAPAFAHRKIYILGEAERMVVREDAEEAAGAFLKLLEEPSPRTNIILTTSEPGALIPTIRSRLVAVRVAPLGAAEVDAVLTEPGMQQAVVDAGGPANLAEQRQIAAGAPGSLLAGAEWVEALARAGRMLDAASGGDRREQMKTALLQGSSKARGAFTTALDALTSLLHQRVRTATERGQDQLAAAAARALDDVELAKERAAGNVSPQLITSELMRQLEAVLS